ncbi:MAG TPA: hypothetical protein VGD64_03270 [Acidisarcina sp.]
MKERYAFWQGVMAGIFGGIAIGALVRLSAAEAERLRNSSGIPARRNPAPTASNYAGNDRETTASAPRLQLRRDGAESAGDPRITGPVPTLGAISGRAFERPPGAPGGHTPAEILEAPGRPGRHMDHSTQQPGPVQEEEALPVL